MSTLSDLTVFVRDQWTAIPPLPPDNSLAGQTWIVTGSNTGIGFCAAQDLLRLGANVILAVRSLSRGEAAETRLRAATPLLQHPDGKQTLRVMQIDMGSFASVKSFAAQAGRLDRIDGVIANAAVAQPSYTESEGIETMLAVNVVGTMLLAELLLPKLQESARRYGTRPVIELVGSEVALWFDHTLDKVGEGDVLLGLGKEALGERYPATKLALLHAAREFASRHPVADTGVVVNYVNPGFCATELLRNESAVAQFFVGLLRLALGRSAEQGGRLLVVSALLGTASHGAYVANGAVHQERIKESIKSPEGAAMQKRVWADVSKRFAD